MANILKILNEILEILKGNKIDKLVLTLDETVAITNISRSRLNEIINTEGTDFPYFHNGRRILVNKEELKKWLKDISTCHKEV